MAARAITLGAAEGAAMLSSFMTNATHTVLRTLDALEANLTYVATCCVEPRGCPQATGDEGRGGRLARPQVVGLLIVALFFAVLNGPGERLLKRAHALVML